MRLWGKVARGMLLVFAAVFAAVAVLAPEMRSEAIVAVVLFAAAALFGVPALVRVFSAFTGDEEVLEKGTPGVATITSLTPTRWRYNRSSPIVRFGLDVEAAGVYPVEIKQAVDPNLLPRLAPGVVVGVRVDPLNRKKVVIDWRQPIRTAMGATVDESATAGAQVTVVPAAKRSLWPFLRWAFLVFGLIFLRLGCEEGYYETGGTRVQGGGASEDLLTWNQLDQGKSKLPGATLCELLVYYEGGTNSRGPGRCPARYVGKTQGGRCRRRRVPAQIAGHQPDPGPAGQVADLVDHGARAPERERCALHTRPAKATGRKGAVT